MRSLITNDEPLHIEAEGPSRVRSEIEVSEHEGQVRDISVTIDLDHTWTADLEIALEGPKGQRVILVTGEGGRGDDFRDTTFDDSATASIAGASAPFRGVFRPEQSLAAFDGSDPNGVWTLHVDDRAALDGGRLNRWTLGIETCCFEFESDTRVRIDPGGPNSVRSSIEVRGLGGLLVEDVAVWVDLDHSWDSDLTLTLIAPDRRDVVLADRRGGSRDHFRNTAFRDDAEVPIAAGSPPYRGGFRPEQPLGELRGLLADGTWTLEVRDQASQDGGMLRRWGLRISAEQPERPTTSQFSIDVRFLGGLTPSQRSVFQLAAARWAQAIVGDLPEVEVGGERVDDVLIEAEGIAIDGPGRVLGQAGPERLRRGSQLPATGRMSFDAADLAELEAEGDLIHVITHEMGHVLGIGTLWSAMGLMLGAGSANPRFLGPRAMREYADLIGADEPTPVPVANTGGAGTRDGHWREATFGNELMTGFLEGGVSPLSRLTIAALADMGYEVDLDAADPYRLPSALELAALGIGGTRRRICCSQVVPRYVELPSSAVVRPRAAARPKSKPASRRKRPSRRG
jgi:subtilisin-like proprotein convertase family protein